jgi:hypothetical protein
MSDDMTYYGATAMPTDSPSGGHENELEISALGERRKRFCSCYRIIIGDANVFTYADGVNT